MKKINVLRMLAITIIITVGIVSCSSDQNYQDEDLTNFSARGGNPS